MLSTFAILAMVLALTSCAQAQGPTFQTKTIYSLRDKTFSQVAPVALARLDDFLGQSWLHPTLSTFGGVSFENGALNGGFIASQPLRLAKQVDLDLGGYLKFQQGAKPDGGFFLGFSYYFDRN